MKDFSQAQEINLINIVETISKKSAKSQLDLEKLKEIEEDISILANFLNISPLQTVLFSCIVEMSLVARTNIESLARHFKSSPLKVISLMDEIEALVSKGLIRKISKSRSGVSTFNDILFKIPDRVIEGIQKKDRSKVAQRTKFDLPKFLERVYQMAEEVESRLISTSQFVVDTEEMIESNKELKYIRYIDGMIVSPVHKCIVFLLSYLHLIGRSEVDLTELAEDIFDDISDQFSFNQNMTQGSNELIKKELVDLRNSEFGGVKILRISDRCISRLFEENNKLQWQELNSKLMISPATLKGRQLYFNKNQQQEISNLFKTLSTHKYTSIKKQLEQNKFSSGLSVLLYGESGTGKTELVYQIAKKTNREIMMVELSETKSSWFGESEKRVKKIFDDYRMMVKGSRKCPILFINEVDGLLSKRQSIGGHNPSTQNVINTMQNILLQALESFEGILLATTNLTENLDSAFERRFLFKIKITHPDAESRAKIWKSRLPELKLKQVRILSRKFELTGGQIENIVKQTLLTRMVDEVDLFETLEKNCLQEHGYGKMNKVGF